MNHGRPYTPSELDFVRRCRLAVPPVSMEEIGRQMGRSAGSVWGAVRKMGIHVRTERPSREVVAEAVRMREEGYTWKDVAARLGFEKSALAWHVSRVAERKRENEKRRHPDFDRRKSRSGKRPCMCCRVHFYSDDAHLIRLCTPCKSSDANSLPVGW